MKKSRFSEEQILAVLKQLEATPKMAETGPGTRSSKAATNQGVIAPNLNRNRR